MVWCPTIDGDSDSLQDHHNDNEEDHDDITDDLQSESEFDHQSCSDITYMEENEEIDDGEIIVGWLGKKAKRRGEFEGHKEAREEEFLGHSHKVAPPPRANAASLMTIMEPQHLAKL
jgi:hypothetical protein